MKRFVTLLIIVLCSFTLVACEEKKQIAEQIEFKMEKIKSFSDKPFVRNTAKVFVYSYYDKFYEMAIGKNDYFGGMYALLKEHNFWEKRNYDELYYKIINSHYNPVSKLTVLVVLNAMEGMPFWYSPETNDVFDKFDESFFVRLKTEDFIDVIDVLVELNIISSSKKFKLIDENYSDRIYYCQSKDDFLFLLNIYGIKDIWNLLKNGKFTKETDAQDVYHEFERNIMSYWTDDLPYYRDGFYVRINIDASEAEDLLDYFGYYKFDKQPINTFDSDGRSVCENDYLDIKNSWGAY